MQITDICFVSADVYHYLDPKSEGTSGGAERQQHLLGRELRDRNRAVAYIVGDHGQPSEQFLDGMLTTTGCPRQLPTPFHAPVLAGRLWAAMRRVDAAVYYVRGAPRLAVLAGLGCRALGRPLVFCVANDADVRPERLRERYGPAVRQAYRWLLGTADAVVSQTERQQSLLRDRGVESVHIPNGYTLSPEQDILLPSEREFVLWVGSSDPDQKRPSVFLDLARRLPDIPFVMISQPAVYTTSHEQLASKARDIDNLRFLGPVRPDEIHDYYRRASLLVNTSRNEGFPNTFLEAWRQATPVVSLSFDLDGMLADRTGGLHADGFDQLVDDVASLSADVQCRGALGQNGRRLVAEQFSIDRVVERYNRLLGDLAEQYSAD